MSILVTIEPSTPVVVMLKLSEKNKGPEHSWIILTPLDQVDEDGNSMWITIGLLEGGEPVCFSSAQQAQYFIHTILRTNTGIVSDNLRLMMRRTMTVGIQAAWRMATSYTFPQDLVAFMQQNDPKIVENLQ